MMGRPSRTAMLQTVSAFFPVALPEPLGLPIAELQNLLGIHQAQRPASHTPQYFNASQLLPAHGCPLHRTLLIQPAVSWTFFSRTTWDIINKVQHRHIRG